MKRDMDLIREILFQIESSESPLDSESFAIQGHTQDQIAYHLQLLQSVGYIHGIDVSTFDGPAWIDLELTWQGHEFLDDARDDTRWNKAKTLVLQKGGTVSLEVIKGVLTALAKQQLGLP